MPILSSDLNNTQKLNIRRIFSHLSRIKFGKESEINKNFGEIEIGVCVAFDLLLVVSYHVRFGLFGRVLTWRGNPAGPFGILDDAARAGWLWISKMNFGRILGQIEHGALVDNFVGIGRHFCLLTLHDHRNEIFIFRLGKLTLDRLFQIWHICRAHLLISVSQTDKISHWNVHQTSADICSRSLRGSFSVECRIETLGAFECDRATHFRICVGSRAQFVNHGRRGERVVVAFIVARGALWRLKLAPLTFEFRQKWLENLRTVISDCLIYRHPNFVCFFLLNMSLCYMSKVCVLIYITS